MHVEATKPAATRFHRSYPGRQDQVREVRADLALVIDGCPFAWCECDSAGRLNRVKKRSEKGADTTTAQCSCGFKELGDEEIIDHLLHVFEPKDHSDNDGLVHEERDSLRCACGFTAITAEELDSHLLEGLHAG